MSINAIPATNPMTRLKDLRNAQANPNEKDIVHGLTLATGVGAAAVFAKKGKLTAETVRKTGVTLIAELTKGITKLCSCISKKIDAGKANETIEKVANKLRKGTKDIDPNFQEGVSKLLAKCTGEEQAKTIKTALDTLDINNPCAAVDAVAAAAAAVLVADNTADVAEVTLDKLDEQFQEMPDWDC